MKSFSINSSLEFTYNASENSHPRAEGIENAQGKKEGIGNKPISRPTKDKTTKPDRNRY